MLSVIVVVISLKWVWLLCLVFIKILVSGMWNNLIVILVMVVKLFFLRCFDYVVRL